MGQSTQFEQWKPVAGYEDHYEVSDHGRVRRTSGGRGTRPGLRKQSTHQHGYKQVSLSVRNIQSTKKVHRLVLEAFVGPCPDGMEACHADDDPANNYLSNLRWDTHSENHLDRQRLGTWVNPVRYSKMCRNGLHEWTESETAVDARGYRVCIPCYRAKCQRQNERQRELRLGRGAKPRRRKPAQFQ